MMSILSTFVLFLAGAASGSVLAPRASFTCTNNAVCCTNSATTTTDAIVATGCTAGSNANTNSCSGSQTPLCCDVDVTSLQVGIRCTPGSSSAGYQLPNYSSFVLHGYTNSAGTNSKGYLIVHSATTFEWTNTKSQATKFASTSGTPFAIDEYSSTSTYLQLTAPNGNTYGSLSTGGGAENFWVLSGTTTTASGATAYGLSITFTDASTGSTAVGDVYSAQESSSTSVTDIKVLTDGNANQINSLVGAYVSKGVIPGQVWLFAE